MSSVAVVRKRPATAGKAAAAAAAPKATGAAAAATTATGAAAAAPTATVEAAAATTAEAATKADYKVGFCRCAYKPHRVLTNDRKKRRGWGTVVEPELTGPDSTLVRAKWQDDFSSALDITKGDYMIACKKVKATRKGANILWQGESKEKVPLRLLLKEDRAPLIILKKGLENKGQICQLRLNWLESTNPTKEKMVEAGLQIMQGVAEALVAGEVDEKNVFKKRDELLKKHGMILNTDCGAPAAAVSKPTVQKKPSAESDGGAAAVSKAVAAASKPVAESDGGAATVSKPVAAASKPVEAASKPVAALMPTASMPTAASTPRRLRTKKQKQSIAKNCRVAKALKAVNKDQILGQGLKAAKQHFEQSSSDIEPPMMF